MTTASKDNDTLSSTTKPNSTAFIILRCYRFLLPYWRYAAGAYIGLLLITVSNLAIPQFIRWIIDHGINGNERTLFGLSVLVAGTLSLLGLTLLKGVLTFFQGRWTEIAAQSVAFDLRNAIQTKLTLLSFSFHDQSETGQLLSRAVQDVERVRFLTGRASLRLLDSIVLAVSTAAILVTMNPRLALLVTLTLPLLAHRAFFIGARMRPLGVQIQDQLGILTTRLEQSLRGARVVKAFAQEPREIERFEKENETWFHLSNDAAKVQSIHGPLLDLISNLGAVAIILYGGLLVIQKQLTVGELVAFSTYMGQLYNPIRLAGNIVPAIAMAASAAGRIFEILDAIPDVHDEANAQPLGQVNGRVRFENVSFAYAGTRTVLERINLDVQPGQVIALLGATGSGKSTIISLIPRFYDPTQGRILIDEQDIRQVTLQSLRSQIGLVLQETTLFIGSIYENISFGRQEATREEVIEAARSAQAHEFISAMPHGYDTIVGERGVTLSGGQKQRIALARALLTDPCILILDDATASVDTSTERLIQHALDRLMEGRTTFVIAHRLSTVRRADLILVLEKGRIIAQGKHEELLQTSPLYAEVYTRQLRPDTAEGGTATAASGTAAAEDNSR
jgi:ATP-binding cassette, subfamily B, multidrug efflux pump